MHRRIKVHQMKPKLLLGLSAQFVSQRRKVDRHPRFGNEGLFRSRPTQSELPPSYTNVAEAGFNGAAIVRSRKFDPGDRFGSGFRCFNGAAIVRSRKYPGDRADQSGQDDASMGPRSLDRGNLPPSIALPALESRFNGAAIVRLRKSRTFRCSPGSPSLLQWVI